MYKNWPVETYDLHAGDKLAAPPLDKPHSRIPSRLPDGIYELCTSDNPFFCAVAAGKIGIPYRTVTEAARCEFFRPVKNADIELLKFYCGIPNEKGPMSGVYYKKGAGFVKTNYGGATMPYPNLISAKSSMFALYPINLDGFVFVSFL